MDDDTDSIVIHIQKMYYPFFKNANIAIDRYFDPISSLLYRMISSVGGNDWNEIAVIAFKLIKHLRKEQIINRYFHITNFLLRYHNNQVSEWNIQYMRDYGFTNTFKILNQILKQVTGCISGYTQLFNSLANIFVINKFSTDVSCIVFEYISPDYDYDWQTYLFSVEAYLIESIMLPLLRLMNRQ